jgi:hypothetical protein
VTAAWLTALTALAVAVFGLLGWAGRKVWRFLRRTIHFLDDWNGEASHDGVPGHPGVMARLKSVEELATRILEETTPNGGGNLRDVVRRTAQDVADIKAEQVAVRARLELFEARRAAREEKRDG